MNDWRAIFEDLDHDKNMVERKLPMENELSEIDKQINECYAMIDHFIQLKDRGIEYATQELADWRRMLQNAKIYKRRLLNT